jgi:hypothetical protein
MLATSKDYPLEKGEKNERDQNNELPFLEG